jgi:hypothetical protein
MPNKVLASSLLKVLTFVPIVALVFYTDFDGWLPELASAHLLGFAVTAVSLIGYGAFLKRRVIAAYVEISDASFSLGLVALLASALLYLFGSVLYDQLLFHFGALLLLVLSYCLLRFSKRLAQLLVPLLAIAGLAFVPLLTTPVIGSAFSALSVSLLMLGIFVLYSGYRTNAVIVSSIVAALSLGYWFNPFAEIGYVLLGLVPLSVLVFSVSNGPRSKFGLATMDTAPTCSHDPSTVTVEGFCKICGKKLGSGVAPLRPNFLALLLVFVVVFSILAFQVPILSVNGGTPATHVYAYSGETISPFFATPSGWLINSSVPLQINGDISALQTVYVPSFHPEVSNYTFVAAVGLNQVLLGSGTGGELPGWNITNHFLYTVGRFDGYITVYQAGTAVLMNFDGSSHSTFLNGNAFEQLAVGVSLTRQFKGFPQTNATMAFENDLQTVFYPSLNSVNYPSSWTEFLSKATDAISVFAPILEVAVVSALIVWTAYRIKLFDAEEDRRILRVSDLKKDDWSLYAMLTDSPIGARTTLEISNLIAGQVGIVGKSYHALYESLERLRIDGLVKSVFSESGSDIFLAWKVLA